MAKVPALVLAVVLVACAQSSRYAYAPVSTMSADVEGRKGAIVRFPPDSPCGELRIAALAVTTLSPEASTSRAMLVRFVLVNDGEETWSFDEAEQRLDLDDGSSRWESHALTSHGQRAPVVAVPSRQRVALDVLFPIGARDAGDLRGFDVLWRARAGARSLAGRVPFVRQTLPVPIVPPPDPLPAQAPSFQGQCQ